MDAKICDRCKNYYVIDEDAHVRNGMIVGHLDYRYRDLNELSCKILDLCPKCTENLKEWIKNENQDN